MNARTLQAGGPPGSVARARIQRRTPGSASEGTLRRRALRKGRGRVDIVEQLAGVTVLDLDGNEVALASLWQERTVVLVFLRHYG